MKRNVVLFLATFAVGAIIAFAARAALHEPHAATTAIAHAPPETTPLVSNALTPATSPVESRGEHAHHAAKSAAPVANANHDTHAAPAKPQPPAETVNTRCAICGMPVDPSLPTLEYQGKKIGFGCKMCAPKFQADPDKYGPIYLRNEVIKH
jgi:hypothetical protein